MRRFPLLLACLLLAGCPEEGTSAADAADPSDTLEVDIATMDGGRLDSGEDAGDDAGSDGDDDAGEDAADDTGEDAGEDAPRDAIEDAPADTDRPDAPADTDRPDAPADTDRPDAPADTDRPDAPADTDRPDAPADITDASDSSDAVDSTDVSDDAADAADSTDTSDTSDTADSGGDVVEPEECDGARRSFDGTFCDGGCTVALDELLPTESGFRNGSPSLALGPDCDPQILFSRAVGGFSGYHGIRRADSWSVLSTPFAFARASYVLDAAGVGYSLSADGAFGISGDAFGRGTRAWGDLPEVSVEGYHRAGNLIIGARGSVQGAAVDRDDNLHLLTLGEFTWASTPTGITASPTAFRTSPGDSGTPHLAAFSTVDGGGDWQLEWWTGATGSEVAATLGSSSLNTVSQVFDLAVGASAAGNASGVPHILLGRQGATVCDQPMSVVSRNADGTWSEAPVPVNAPATCSPCDAPPSGSRDSCDYDWVDFLPLSMLVSQGGDVAVLYMRRHWTGSRLADCDGPRCVWTDVTSANTADLFFARPGLSRPTRLIADDAWFTEGRTMVDSLGRIHIAAYDRGTGDVTVRYVRVDPRP